MIPAGRLDRDRPAPATPLVDRSAQLSELDERRRSAKAAIDALLARVVSFVEPAVLVFMGIVIATILMAVYLPLFTILSNMKG